MKTQSKQVTDQQHDSANTNLISSGAGGGLGGGGSEKWKPSTTSGD